MAYRLPWPLPSAQTKLKCLGFHQHTTPSVSRFGTASLHNNAFNPPVRMALLIFFRTQQNSVIGVGVGQGCPLGLRYDLLPSTKGSLRFWVPRLRLTASG